MPVTNCITCGFLQSSDNLTLKRLSLFHMDIYSCMKQSESAYNKVILLVSFMCPGCILDPNCIRRRCSEELHPAFSGLPSVREAGFIPLQIFQSLEEHAQPRYFPRDR